MNGQLTLEGTTVPVQITEKVTTTIKFSADYFLASLSGEKVTDIQDHEKVGEHQVADEVIVRALRAHRSIPDNVLGRAFRADFERIKAAILGYEANGSEDDVGKTRQVSGSGVEQVMSHEGNNEEDARTKSLIEELLTREDDIQEYLINNFQEDLIRGLAAKLHIEVEEDELPQTTASNIATAIQEYRNKGASR